MIGILLSSSKLGPNFKRSSCKLSRETVIGIVLCCCDQACRLLYYLGKINCGIHMYQFTFGPSLLFSDVVEVSDLNKNLGGSPDWRKKGTDWRIYKPLFTPLLKLYIPPYLKDKVAFEEDDVINLKRRPWQGIEFM